MRRKVKVKFTDFECNLLINGMNEFRNMLLADGLPTDDVLFDILLDNFFLLSYNDHIKKQRRDTYAAEK